MRRFLLIAAVFAVVLLYGLTVATGSSNVLSDYFGGLLLCAACCYWCWQQCWCAMSCF